MLDVTCIDKENDIYTVQKYDKGPAAYPVLVQIVKYCPVISGTVIECSKMMSNLRLTVTKCCVCGQINSAIADLKNLVKI